jgi:hypothetical protein
MDSIEVHRNPVQRLAIPSPHNPQGSESSTGSLPKPDEIQVARRVSDEDERPSDDGQQEFEVLDVVSRSANEQPTALR